jgi:hypothetical protein
LSSQAAAHVREQAEVQLRGIVAPACQSLDFIQQLQSAVRKSMLTHAFFLTTTATKHTPQIDCSTMQTALDVQHRRAMCRQQG